MIRACRSQTNGVSLRTMNRTTRWFWGSVCILCTGLSMVLVGRSWGGDRCHLKAGILTPEGTAYTEFIRKIEAEVAEKTDHACRFTIYAGGVQGDEPAVLQKMRLGQLNMGFFSGMGLSKIDPAVEILEIPGLLDYQSGLDVAYREADYLYEKMLPVFQKRFSERGFQLITFAGQGMLYLYTTKRVETFEDLQALRFEHWEGLPLSNELVRLFDLNAVPISIPEVLTALQTGLLEAVWATPLILVSLQWHTEVAYAIDYPITYGLGGMVITKKMWDQIPPDHQKVIAETVRKYVPAVHQRTRRDDQVVWESFPEHGIEYLTPKAELVRDLLDQAVAMRQALVGKFYPQAILDEVLFHLKEFRSKASTSN